MRAAAGTRRPQREFVALLGQIGLAAWLVLLIAESSCASLGWPLGATAFRGRFEVVPATSPGAGSASEPGAKAAH